MNALTPYMLAIKLGLVAVLIIAARVEGCSSGKRAGLEAGETERLTLAAQATNSLADANACSASLNRVNTETARGIREAEARAAAGERAAEIAKAIAAQTKTDMAAAASRLQAAKLKPTCRTQLEVALCESIPLL